jgi:hypothetical protein
MNNILGKPTEKKDNLVEDIILTTNYNTEESNKPNQTLINTCSKSSKQLYYKKLDTCKYF